MISARSSGGERSHGAYCRHGPTRPSGEQFRLTAGCISCTLFRRPSGRLHGQTAQERPWSCWRPWRCISPTRPSRSQSNRAPAWEVAVISTDWAQPQNILQADHGEGPWRVFTDEDMEKRFHFEGQDYLGLPRWIARRCPSWRRDRMRRGLGVPCWDTPDAIAPKSGTQEPQLEWQVPLAAEATGATLHTAAMGQGGPVTDNFGQPVDRFSVFRVDGQPEDHGPTAQERSWS